MENTIDLTPHIVALLSKLQRYSDMTENYLKRTALTPEAKAAVLGRKKIYDELASDTLDIIKLNKELRKQQEFAQGREGLFKRLEVKECKRILEATRITPRPYTLQEYRILKMFNMLHFLPLTNYTNEIPNRNTTGN